MIYLPTVQHIGLLVSTNLNIQVTANQMFQVLIIKRYSVLKTSIDINLKIRLL